MISKLSLFAIRLYQTYISPKKGYACAYRVEYADNTGCSGYAKHRIQEVGLMNAIPDIRARFKACRTAAEERAERRRQRQENAGEIACLGIDGCDTCGSAGGKLGAKKCDGCDACDGPDCGSCS